MCQLRCTPLPRRTRAALAGALVLVLAVSSLACSGSGSLHSARPRRQSILLRVGSDRLVRGPEVINLRQGDTLELRLQSTETAEETLLVKGYGQRGELDAADGTTRLVFVVDRVGAFPIVKEENGAALATLIVR
jgi:hypothetical protein